MKIFYICYENSSLQRASTTHIKEVTEHLRKTGNDVILFAPNIGKYKNETTVHTVYIPTLKVRFINEYIYYVCLFFYLFAYQIKLKSDIFYIREMGVINYICFGWVYPASTTHIRNKWYRNI